MIIASDVIVFENMSKQRNQWENKKHRRKQRRAISQEVELMEVPNEINKVIESLKDTKYKTICGETTTKQNGFSI